jgi:hypothetical protein
MLSIILMPEAEMPEPGDLTEQLAETARQTVLNHRKALESGAGHLRSITVEIETRRSGEVTDSHVWIEHQGSHRTRKEPTG